MKKVLSITIAILLIMSSIFMTTAFAETASTDEVTTYPAIPNDPTTPGLDAETELEIKQTIMDKYSLAEDGLTTDDVTLEYFGTLSDGSILIRYRFTGMSIIAVIIEDIIGNYEYIVDAAQQVDLYKNGTIYTIKDANDTGVIADNVLDEAAEILDFAYVEGDTAGLDVKTVLQIKQDVLNYLSWGDELTIDDVSIVYKGTLSDGSMLIRYETTGMDFDAAVHVDEIGSYIYTYGAPDMFSIYKNNTFYTIKGAYDAGVITDDVLNEIAKILNFTYADGDTAGLDVKTALEIKQTIVNRNPSLGLTTDDITLEYLGTLSDGRILLRYFGIAAPQNVRVYEMGKYIYSASNGFDEVYIYGDHNYYQIKEAYDLGLISESALDEIAEILNLPLKNEPTSPKEEATNPQTTPDETKSQSTPDTVVNNNNNNSAIQTGQNASSALAATGIVTLLAAGALLIIRRRFV